MACCVWSWRASANQHWDTLNLHHPWPSCSYNPHSPLWSIYYCINYINGSGKYVVFICMCRHLSFQLLQHLSSLVAVSFCHKESCGTDWPERHALFAFCRMQLDAVEPGILGVGFRIWHTTCWEVWFCFVFFLAYLMVLWYGYWNTTHVYDSLWQVICICVLLLY